MPYSFLPSDLILGSMQSSCAFASMASNPEDLTLGAAESVVQFLAAHISGLQTEYAAAAVAPLPNGDPFK